MLPFLVVSTKLLWIDVDFFFTPMFSTWCQYWTKTLFIVGFRLFVVNCGKGLLLVLGLCSGVTCFSIRFEVPHSTLGLVFGFGNVG
jgi:hypothetical protein